MSQARRHSTLLRDSGRNSSLSLLAPRPTSRRSSLAVVPVPGQRPRCLRKLLSATALTVEQPQTELAELSSQTLQTIVSQDSVV